MGFVLIVAVVAHEILFRGWPQGLWWCSKSSSDYSDPPFTDLSKWTSQLKSRVIMFNSKVRL
jgi:hypothetical protein